MQDTTCMDYVRFLQDLARSFCMGYIEDLAGYLQILWESPTLYSDELHLQNISIKRYARILSYKIYITTEESTIVQFY